MPSITTIALSVIVSLAFGSTASADVQLSIRDGRVSMVATDATARQILAEWAAIGQTTIVNVERVPSDPMTIELENVSEAQALDVVLRQRSGYIAAPRATAVPNASRFDRIIIMPISVIPAAVAVSAPPRERPSEAPAYQTPLSYEAAASAVLQISAPLPSSSSDAIADEPGPEATIAIPGVDPRGPTPNPARQALEVVDPRRFHLPPQPQGGTVVSPIGGAPAGVAVPGTVAQPAPRRPGGPG